LKVFKQGHKEASLGDRLRKLLIKFRLQTGYSSIFDYLKKIDSMLEEYLQHDETPSAAQEAQYVKILMDNFPSDPLHKRLKQLIEDEGKPTTLADFRKKVLMKGGRLHDSYNDMVACGLCGDKLKEEKPDRPASKPKPKGEQNAVPHRGCGRIHTGDCIYRKHPDFNNTDLDWDKSPKGIAWASAGETKLPHAKTLDPNAKYTPPEFAPTTSKGQKRQRGEEYLCTLINNVTNNDLYTSDTIPFTLRSTKGITREVGAFIDTGALHGNYVSKEIAEFLVDSNVAYCSCITEVCSPVNNTCYLDHDNKLFKLNIFNKTANFDFTFEATILDSKYDIIIGRPTIKQFNLLKVFDKYFLNEQELKLAPKKKNKLIHQRLNRARKSHPPIDDTSSSRTRISTTLAMVTNGVRSIPMKHFIHTIPRDDDEINAFHNDAPWEVEVPDINNENSEKPLPKFEGSEELQTKLKTLYSAYEDIFSIRLKEEPAKIKPFKLEVDDLQWQVPKNNTAPRPQSIPNQLEIQTQIKELLAKGVITESQELYNSQVHLVPKPNGKKRFTIDFRNLNHVSKSMGWPLPRIDHMLRRVGSQHPKYFAVMDLTSGYHQCPIDEESMKYTSFRTSGGCYQWKRLPMGLKAAPAHFQQQMASTVLGPLLYDICEIYLDDVIIYGETEEEYLQNIEKVLKRFRECNITINPTKCTFGASKIQYTGHVLSAEGLSFDANRIENVLNFPKPTTQQELKSFLGFVTYFHEHIKNYSMIVAPLHNMLHGYNKKVKRLLTWDDTTNAALDEITNAIRDCPTLFFIDDHSPIYLHTDASDFGIGAYLYQVRDDKEHPIQFISKAFKREQLRWDTPEKEAYAIFYALKKLQHLLRDVHFTLRTDHKNLTFLNKGHTGKVERWKMAIQEYDFDMEFIPGRDNIIADILSRINRIDNSDPIVQELNLLEQEYKIPADKYKLISAVHNTVVGHHGVERTVNKLHALLKEKAGEWQYMTEHVRQFIRRHCPCCQKMSQLKIPIHAARFTTATYSIMERVSVDVCGPFPEDDYGNTDLIVLIDNFSRYLEIYPMPDKSAKSIARCLLQWVGRYGSPSQLLSDNGKEFVNEIIKEFKFFL